MMFAIVMCYPFDCVLKLSTHCGSSGEAFVLRQVISERAFASTNARARNAMSLPEADPSEEGGVMLVLSRKPGERILIGDEVAVTIVRIGPNTVRLGIDAPRSMNIVREELCGRNQNAESTASPRESVEVAAGD